MALCKVMIIGNLGADPEMRYTPSGRPVTQFNVAVNQSTKNQQTGEWVEATDWFRISVWGDRAERAAESSKLRVQALGVHALGLHVVAQRRNGSARATRSSSRAASRPASSRVVTARSGRRSRSRPTAS